VEDTESRADAEAAGSRPSGSKSGAVRRQLGEADPGAAAAARGRARPGGVHTRLAVPALNCVDPEVVGHVGGEQEQAATLLKVGWWAGTDAGATRQPAMEVGARRPAAGRSSRWPAAPAPW
jgi:hypothetical protein